MGDSGETFSLNSLFSFRGRQSNLRWRIKMKKKLWFSFGLGFWFSFLVFLLAPASQTAAQNVIKWKGHGNFHEMGRHLPSVPPRHLPGVHAITGSGRSGLKGLRVGVGHRLGRTGGNFRLSRRIKLLGKGVIQWQFLLETTIQGEFRKLMWKLALVFAWPTAAAEYDCLYNYGLYAELKRFMPSTI